MQVSIPVAKSHRICWEFSSLAMGPYEENFRGLREPSSGGMSCRLVRQQPPADLAWRQQCRQRVFGGFMRQVADTKGWIVDTVEVDGIPKVRYLPCQQTNAIEGRRDWGLAGGCPPQLPSPGRGSGLTRLTPLSGLQAQLSAFRLILRPIS